MKKFGAYLYVKAAHFMEKRVKNVVANERGSQALEWIGVAAVIITLVTFLSKAVGDNEGKVGEFVGKIFTKMSSMIGG